ncbi:MAG: cellulose synthase operon protein YhjQ/BcsQ, partial [Ilumatobacteraceae bacterium]
MHCTGGVMIGCWSTKGGSGTTVIAAALALSRAGSGTSVRLVDACGDLPAALGIAEPSGPGLTDWLATSRHDSDDFAARFLPVTANLSLLPRGNFDELTLRAESVAHLSRAL